MRQDISTLFLDIGGVLLTNGWDRHERRRAAERFDLAPDDLDERHHLTFDTYEEGKLTLDQYLDRVIFHQERSFGREDFKQFMFGQSQPFPAMMNFVSGLKKRYGLRVVAVSNEGKELNEHRVATYGLKDFIDFFVSSCYVHMRKPDEDMFRLALNCSQSVPERTVYLDDRKMFVEVACSMGIHGVHHRDVSGTKRALADLGLAVEE